ncbi:RNA polymerase I termination factor, partial [Teratosphaeria destructans]
MGNTSSQPNPTQMPDATAEDVLQAAQTRAPSRRAKKRKIAIEADDDDDDGDDAADFAVKPRKKKARNGRGKPRNPAQLVREDASGGDGDDAGGGGGAPIKAEESDEGARRRRKRKKRRTADDHMLEMAKDLMPQDSPGEASPAARNTRWVESAPGPDDEDRSVAGDSREEVVVDDVVEPVAPASDKKKKKKKRKKRIEEQAAENGGRGEPTAGEAEPVSSPRRRTKRGKPQSAAVHDAPPDVDGLHEDHHGTQDGLTDRDEEIEEELRETGPGRKNSTASEPKRPAGHRPNVGRTEKVQLPDPLFDGPVKGMFTAAEKAALDDVFDYTVQTSRQYNSAADLMRQIIDWKNASDFKEEAETALPNRTKPAIRKFCQRRFTLAQRGPWTKEEDDILRQAYAENPDKWVEIAALTDRRPADCKDRWRNILQCGEKRETGPWSAEEAAQLMDAVEACIKAMKAQSGTHEGQPLPSTRGELESMVDWKTVQQKLDNKRSAKRCREKWQQLNRNGNVSKLPSKVEARPSEVLREVYDQESNRQRRVERAFALFEPGDYFDVLTEIHTAIGDPDKVFQHDSTVWSIVSQKHPESHFSGALRRRAYYAALDHYTGKSVRKATTIAGKAHAITKLMIRWADAQGTTVDHLKRGLDAAKTRAKRQKRQKRKLRMPKSAELVVDSGDEAASEHEDETQHDADVDGQSDDASAAASDEAVKGQQSPNALGFIESSEDEHVARAAPLPSSTLSSQSGCLLHDLSSARVPPSPQLP